MPRPESDRPRVTAFLRVTWDDRAREGRVVAALEAGGFREQLLDRSCDAWCLPYHARKGAERLLEALGVDEAPQWAGEMFEGY